MGRSAQTRESGTFSDADKQGPLAAGNLSLGNPVFLLSLILVCGFSLRVWHTGFGYPAVLHPDEWAKYRVVKRIVGGLNPEYFQHPGFLVNSAAIVVKLSQPLFGADRPFFDVLWPARFWVVILGTLTLVPVFFLTRAVYGSAAACLASAFLAVSPMHVVHSRYVKEDVPLVLFVCLSLWGLICWMRTGNAKAGWGWFALAVAGAALSLASKFVGALALILLVGTVLSGKASWKRKTIVVLSSCLGAAVVFLLASPQVLHWEVTRPNFLYELGRGVKGPGYGPVLRIHEWPDWGTYFFVHGLGPGLTWPICLVGTVGMVQALRGLRKEPGALLLAITALAWYLLAELTPQKLNMDSERYVMPALAILCPLGAGWLWARIEHKRFRYYLIPILLIFPLAQTLLINLNLEPDTRTTASQWLREEGPREPFQFLEYNTMYRGVESPYAKWVPGSIHAPEEVFQQNLRQADALVISSFHTDRYERARHRSRFELDRLEQARKVFPYGIVFQKPAFVTTGFHHPRVELYFRRPYPGAQETAVPGKRGF